MSLSAAIFGSIGWVELETLNRCGEIAQGQTRSKAIASGHNGGLEERGGNCIFRVLHLLLLLRRTVGLGKVSMNRCVCLDGNHLLGYPSNLYHEAGLYRRLCHRMISVRMYRVPLCRCSRS